MTDVLIKTGRCADLASLSLDSVDRFGSKACMLGVLNTLGLLVPNGYALSFNLFDDFMASNSIVITHDECLQKNEDIRSQILWGDFPAEALRELLQVYDIVSKNGQVKLAVRSSARSEDGKSQSLAGMFESYLYVASFEMYLEAIKKCYASHFTEKALGFLSANRVVAEDLKMGVIVQQFVEGQYSGVAFTADVTTMSEEQVHLQVVNGICQDFVSGKKEYAHYVICKKSGNCKIRPDAGASLLTAQQINEVYRMAMVIELFFGVPQDIEWTLKHDRIYVLQTRPVTTLKRAEFPLCWEKAEDVERRWLRLSDEPVQPFLRDVYLESNVLFSEGAWDTMISLSSCGDMQEHHGYLYFSPMRIALDRRQIQARRAQKFAEIWRSFERGENMFYDNVLPELMNILGELKLLTKRARAPAAEILPVLDLGLEYARVTRRWHWPLRLAYDCIDKFYNVCSRIKPGLTNEDYFDLLYEKSMFTRFRELCIRMATVVKGAPQLRELFNTCPYDEILFIRLKVTPGADALLTLVDEFLHHFGLCSMDDKRRISPVFYEQPHTIVALIRSSMSLDPAEFEKNTAAIMKNKVRLKNELLQAVPGGDKAQFLVQLRSAERSFLSVDNNNHYLVKMGYGPLRLALRYAGRCLKQHGMLKEIEDVYFLTYAEIREMAHGGNACAFANKVETRKILFEKQRRMAAPLLIGKGIAENRKRRFVWPRLWNRKVVLRGVSGLAVKTAGIIHKGFLQTGIKREKFSDQVDENTILVLHHAHAGEDIMPFLRKVRGVIYGWGSPYDHPGIMARELGIPALYNVNISALNEGDEVELDGVSGRVTVIRSARRRRKLISK